MKKLSFFLLMGMVFAACSKMPSTGNFGTKITEEGAVTALDVRATLDSSKEWKGKVTGTVQTVCQSEGCWYTLDLGNGENMTIFTKDHSFSLPKDCSGKTAIAEGIAYWEETSVEDLKHLAQDAGKSPEEIAKITEPKKELVFEADGIIIK